MYFQFMVGSLMIFSQDTIKKPTTYQRKTDPPACFETAPSDL
jgi:hypothetical protein